MKALVIADADSYLKWGVARAVDLAESMDVEVVVVDSAVTPSARQRADAVAGRWPEVPVLPVRQVRQRCHNVDAVVFACRGPMIEHLVATACADPDRRPVMVAGIPGLWFPPTQRGLDFRSDMDVLVVHSERERRALADRGVNQGREVGLAQLAYGPTLVGKHRASNGHAPVIFAPQALIPRTVDERVRLWEALVETARAHPEVPVHVKLRGGEDEAQTHREFASFPALAAAHQGPIPENLSFVYGPLADHLAGAQALVTVSSTAALESAAAGVPTLIVGDFGVDEDNLNLVFDGSGLVGSLADLVAMRFYRPDAQWMADNYFHPAGQCDWAATVVELAGDRARVSRLRADRPVVARPTGLKARIGRSRRRAQALGSADTWPYRTALALVTTAAKVRRWRPGGSTRPLS